MSQFRRWRADKQPSDCTYAQLEVVPPQELMETVWVAAEMRAGAAYAHAALMLDTLNSESGGG